MNRKMVLAFVVAAASVAAGLVVAVAAYAAYGPVIPPGPPVPGGFSAVIASRTIGPSGDVLKATVGLTVFRLTIQPRALPRPVQFTLTRPHVSGLRNVIPKGMRLLVGFGFLANRISGEPIRGWFSQRPVTIAVYNHAVTRAALVLEWNQSSHRFVRIPAIVRNGQAVIGSRHFAEVLVVAPG